jgi:hypothetical protein
MGLKQMMYKDVGSIRLTRGRNQRWALVKTTEISVSIIGEEFTHLFNLRQHYVTYCLSAPLRARGEQRYSSRIGKNGRTWPPAATTGRASTLLSLLCDVNLADGGHIGGENLHYKPISL